MIGHKVDQQLVEQLVELELPAVAAHLRELSLSLSFVTSQWFLCLFLNSLPSEATFRVWDLVFCLHPCWLFQISLALVSVMEQQSLLETNELGPAVYVMRATQRGAFELNELLAVCDEQFPHLTNDRIDGYRREWRRTTMEALHAKLRVREMYEQQTQDFRFGHQQARSLLIALHLDGSERNRDVSEAELSEALGRVLPDHECTVLLSFLKETVRTAAPKSPEQSRSSTRTIGGGGSGSEAGRGGFAVPAALVTSAADSLTIGGSQLAVCVAVLCEGALEHKLKLCFDGFDSSGQGKLTRAELIGLLQAVYRTYYKQPPSEREVRAFADAVFMDAGGQLRPNLPLDVFLQIGPSQPTLVACFSAHRKHVLRTPRSVNQRHNYLINPNEGLPNGPLGSMLGAIPLLVPTCLNRPSKNMPPRKPLNPNDVRPTANSPSNLIKGKDVVPGQSQIGALASNFSLFGKGAATVLSDALGGALDGALDAMKVPPHITLLTAHSPLPTLHTSRRPGAPEAQPSWGRHRRR